MKSHHTKSWSYTAIILLALMFIGQSSSAQIGLWKQLGSRKVNYRVDKDVINVGVEDGRFTKLKVIVTGGQVNMHKMTVVYGNGDRDEIPLRYNFKRNSDSRVIDLEGRRRVIKKIIFWYDSKNISRKRATVTVFGKK